MAVFLQAAAEGRVGGVREGVKQVTREEPGAKEERTLAPVSRGPPDAIIWQTARHQLVRESRRQLQHAVLYGCGSSSQLLYVPYVC